MGVTNERKTTQSINLVYTKKLTNIPNSQQILQLYMPENFHHSMVLHLMQSRLNNTMEFICTPKHRLAFIIVNYTIKSASQYNGQLMFPVCQTQQFSLFSSLVIRVH